jgi:hypothetical protein
MESLKDYLSKPIHSVTHYLHRLSYVRKSRLYCVGTAKSGTHSIAAMFDDTVRTGHEPDSEQIICKILDISRGHINEADLVSFIHSRDKRLCLDVDSSQLNFFLVDMLIKEFHDARFVLTFRNCYAWLDSFINHSLRKTDVKPEWAKLRDVRFKAAELTHPPEEQILKEQGLYTIDGYLSY